MDRYPRRICNENSSDIASKKLHFAVHSEDSVHLQVFVVGRNRSLLAKKIKFGNGFYLHIFLEIDSCTDLAGRGCLRIFVAQA